MYIKYFKTRPRYYDFHIFWFKPFLGNFEIYRMSSLEQ